MKVGYNDQLDGDRQISAEEKIAAALLDNEDIEIGDDVAAQAGRDILYLVLREFRPELFDDANRHSQQD